MDKTWERVACHLFLDAKHSFILTRFQVRYGGMGMSSGLLFVQELEENGGERNKGQEIPSTWILKKGNLIDSMARNFMLFYNGWVPNLWNCYWYHFFF